jgi:hypothetical protein
MISRDFYEKSRRELSRDSHGLAISSSSWCRRRGIAAGTDYLGVFPIVAIYSNHGIANDLGRCEKVQGEISRVFRCRLFARGTANN